MEQGKYSLVAEAGGLIDLSKSVSDLDAERKDAAINMVKSGMVLQELDDILTVQEVASYLRVHHATVYKLIKKKILKATMVGQGYRVKKIDLVNYLYANEVGDE